MENTSHFTVLIPTYNRGEYLYYTLKSCEGIAYENVNFIVLDDCSTDDTVKIVNDFIERDTRFKLSVASENVGMRRNFERGLCMVKDWVLYLGGDDGLFPDIFTKLNSLIKSGNHDLITWPTCSFFYPGVRDDLGQLVYPRISVNSRSIDSFDFYKKQIQNLYYVVDPEIPMLYVKSVVKISVIKKYNDITGSNDFFTQPTPDGFSAFALLSVLERYFFYNDCLSIHGVSPTSMGLAHLERKNIVQKKMSQQFFDSAKNDRMTAFLGSTEYSVLISIMTTDYLKAVRNANPVSANNAVDDMSIETVLGRAFKELEDGKYGDEAREREFRILHEICRAHGKLDLFNRLKSAHRVNKRSILSGDAISIKRVYLNANSRELENINSAINYIDSLQGNKVLKMYKSVLSLNTVIKSLKYFLKSFVYEVGK